MEHQTEHEAAIAAVEAAESAGNVAAARIVFDALDASTPNLTAMDRYDFVLATWQRLIDPSPTISDDDFAVLIARAANHLPEHTIIDLVDARFGDTEKRIRLDDGHGLTWAPDERFAVVSFPVRGLGIADIVFTGAPVRA